LSLVCSCTDKGRGNILSLCLYRRSRPHSVER